MFVPMVSRAIVINKNIVYSDTVLPLKEMGSNLKICSISDVSEYSLEKCLRKIFESNLDVIFNTVQYSKSDKKVYFYTDKKISTKAWEEMKVIQYKPLRNSREIVEEITRLFNQEKVKDNDCISLYDVARLVKKNRQVFKDIISEYENYFECALEKEFYDLSIIIYDFNYNKNQLRIGFNYNIGIKDDYDKIIFEKENGDLYIIKSESSYSQDILTNIGKELSELYDVFINYSDFNNQFNYGIQSLNSNFFVDVSHYGVSVSARVPSINDFELSSHSYKDGYDFKCNSTSVLSELQGKEDEIFKRLFVKIDDCPEWSRQALYEIRQEQLEEEERLEEEGFNREMRKQKSLEFKRRFFPWLDK